MNKRVVAPPAVFQLTSLAPEEITALGHDQPQTADPGASQIPATVDPLFNASGKPLGDLSVELSGGRSATPEQFAPVTAATDGQSVLSDDDKFLPSGAHFSDPFIDPLPEALLGPLPRGASSRGMFGDAQDGAGLGDSFAGLSGAAHAQQVFSTPTPSAVVNSVVNSVPGGIVIPA